MNQRNLKALHEARGRRLGFGTDPGAAALRIPGLAERVTRPACRAAVRRRSEPPGRTLNIRRAAARRPRRPGPPVPEPHGLSLAPLAAAPRRATPAG